MRINYNFQRNILYKKDLNSTFAEENDYCMASKNLNRLKVVLAEKQRQKKYLMQQLLTGKSAFRGLVESGKQIASATLQRDTQKEIP